MYGEVLMKNFEHRKRRIAASLGEYKAPLVLKNATILNVFTKEFEQGDLAISNGYFVGIGEYEGEEEIDVTGKIIVPGFIDGHMHLESSVVTPVQYCRAVLPHGTTAIVADPHEIANVCGTTGIDYILELTKDLPIDVFVMMPSCVPATPFDENGYAITHEDVDHYLENEHVLGLAELMNYPGVFARDEEVIRKIKVTMRHRKMIDGHAPGLSGKQLNAYATAGVFSDHECTTSEEAITKLKRGQWIMIREGTACKNLESLLPLFKEPYCDRCLMVTDDKHPGDLAREGHIDHIIRKAIKLGVEPVTAYRMASYNAATYFGMAMRGAICPGYIADFVVLNDFNTVDIHSVYKQGYKVADMSQGDKPWTIEWAAPVVSEQIMQGVHNTVKVNEVHASDFALKKEKEKIIGLVPGEILTTDEGEAADIDIENDILKLAVVERHHNTGHIGVAFVKGYGLKSGAVATTIAHDSHNLIVVGTNEEDMAFAVRQLKNMQGGMIVVENKTIKAKLELPIAGLMCELPVEETQYKMDLVKEAAYQSGVHENIDPFMTLSFSSLPVIPTLRLTTLGVVDVNHFELL